MKQVLITGGTIFVSKYAAEYYVKKGYDVYVLNRNTKPQPKGVTLIQADRHQLGDKLKGYHFDLVLDITAYTANDVTTLLDALGSYDDYLLVSSSAVYPEYGVQPFSEDSVIGENKFWGKYGTDKIDAEQALLAKDPNAYILRPPYLYGPMNDVYREAFVFDCAREKRNFYLPDHGNLKLQFFHVHDLCRFMDHVLTIKPEQHIFNVGNKETISIRDWVSLCYQIVGETVNFVEVPQSIPQRNYFSFADYEYYLNIQHQETLMPDTLPLEEGLQECYKWYIDNSDCVDKRPYMDFIDHNLS